MTEHVLRFGAGTVRLSMARGRLAGVLAPATPEPAAGAAELVRLALRQPIGSPPLRDIARGKASAAILIPGKARAVGTRDYVPPLLDELNAAGVPDSGIEVFLADGTHDQHLGKDIADLLGQEVLDRVRCVGHDPKQTDNLRHLGVTSRGTPVLFNRRVLDAGIRVLTGRIVPHYFAGFAGGRKAMLPGVAGLPTILANHKLVLAPLRGIRDGVGPCALTGNAVHEDMIEAVGMARPEFCLNTLMDGENRMVKAVAGEPMAAHAHGCELAMGWLRRTLPAPVDAVIASAGGLPYDTNFMQSIKAVFDVQDIVRPGGAVLWLSEAAGGMNPGFVKWASIRSDEELDAAVRADYALTGHNSVMMRRLIRKARVCLCSALPAESVGQIGLHPVACVEDGVRWLERQFSGDFTYAVVPYANVMCAAVEGRRV